MLYYWYVVGRMSAFLKQRIVWALTRMFFIMKKTNARCMYAFFLLSLVVLAYQTGCNLTPIPNYHLFVSGETCIKPYSRYTYKLGNALDVSVNGEHFIIQAGFETDLASIPRWYWTFLAPQYSAFVTPSIIHDYFYRCVNNKDRRFADSIFYYALINNGVSKHTAYKLYVAVRIFGAHAYVKDKLCTPIYAGHDELEQ